MQNRKALCLSLLDRSFAAVDLTDNFHIEFRLSAIGIKTVHFLLYIVQLGVAEAADVRVVQQSFVLSRILSTFRSCYIQLN